MSLARYPNQSVARPNYGRDISLIRGGASLIRAGRRAYKQYKKGRQTRQASTASDAGPLTSQFDFKTDYRKRKLSRRQRFRQKRKCKWTRRVVHAVREATLGTNHLVRRGAFRLPITTNTSDAVCYGLYGLNGTNNDTNNGTADVGEVFSEMDSASWTNANTGLTAIDHRLAFQHGTLEITLRNVHATNDVVIEAYYIRGRKPLTPVYADPVNAYALGFQKQDRTTDPNELTDIGESELAYTQIGVTPFQNSLFCRHFNIYKRQKFVIPPGKDINITISDSRPRNFRLIESNRYATDRRYHGVLFQQMGIPGLDAGSVVSATPSDVIYMSVRRYRYKFYHQGNPTDSLDTAA